LFNFLEYVDVGHTTGYQLAISKGPQMSDAKKAARDYLKWSMSAARRGPLISQPVIVSGHSLGAARADVMCGLIIADGAPPAERVAALRQSSTANSK
jgi:hypothetical protein